MIEWQEAAHFKKLVQKMKVAETARGSLSVPTDYPIYLPPAPASG